MPIRLAAYSDLLPASKCLARAFMNEGLFGKYMHPHRDQYPEDFYLKFLQMLRDAWAGGPDHQLVVSYTASNDNGSNTETITGIAHWTRMRAIPQSSLIGNVKKSVMSWYSYLESFIYPNRAIDHTRENILSEIGPFVSHFWTGSRAEVWDLTLLGVDPAAGGKGHGKALVAWGFEQAKAEGVGCSVMGAEGTEKFYKSCGFDVIAGGAGVHGGEKNPLIREKIPGGTTLFWDNGRDVSDVKEYGQK
ncbi:putative acyl-CoA N-acyltransferase [Septoria linicola]|nr:putative acyl-CoA N-acyltransferase [Septoria linicola]